MLKISLEEIDQVKSALEAAGGEPVNENVFDAMRIESLVPRLRHELTGDYIPLETGLWDDVSFNKGCYTGQEIIARLESRGKVAKKLVRFDIESGDALPVGTDILADGKSAGTITTSVGNRAMGYVKSAALEKEIALSANGGAIWPDFES